ncbi:response regulator [Caulobacter sp.]|uniref:response regulator n=1 Tax=Caulobacter sp. TaxID=78 RepID=UPI001B1821C9|nr:response regulator [Caulobacter sp.]MBO9545298.1 response regulator [Caulobacter sp.]
MSDQKRPGVTPEQLATLSHEFRTPLNGVLGMARLLENTKLTAEQRSYVTALRESGDHLLSLVNDVLHFARLGAASIELSLAPVDIEGLLRQVAELMSPRAHEKGVEIAWAVPHTLPTIQADEGRLRQILLNFAGNAVKFTEAGGVLLTATATADGRIRFSVADTGPGVAPEARQRIFEAFVQTDITHATQLGGAGLGLAIVARLANAMDGEVGVGGELGQGAEFWFEAPFEIAAPAVRAAPLEGKSVAIASPNAIVRAATVRQIEAAGGRAFAAVDIASALSGAPADAVLLIDKALSGRGAFKPPAGRKAVVLLTPEQRDRIDRLKNAGFSGYLIKPLRAASLVEQVLRAGETETAQTEAPIHDDRIAGAVAQGVRVLLAEDNPINALLARTLLEREGCKVDRVADGEQAVAAAVAGAYDLILMDLRMPGLSGVQAAKALRAKGVAAPIAALTADAFDEDKRACLAAGMDDFLVKPLTQEALRDALKRWTTGGASSGWTKTATRAKVAG